MELIVVTGRAVVVRFKVLDCALGPLNVSELGLKAQLAPTGREPQVRDTLFPNVWAGVTNTEYVAMPPANTVWLEGRIEIEKSVAVNEAVAVLLVFVLLAAVTVAVAE